VYDTGLHPWGDGLTGTQLGGSRDELLAEGFAFDQLQTRFELMLQVADRFGICCRQGHFELGGGLS
jgi:hypothetical protein